MRLVALPLQDFATVPKHLRDQRPSAQTRTAKPYVFVRSAVKPIEADRARGEWQSRGD